VSGDLSLLLFTARVAAIATLLVLAVGLPLSWALSRRGWRGRSLVEALVTLPLVLPPTAVGLALLWSLGRRGPLGAMLHERFGLDVAFTWRAVVVATAVMSLPLFVRSARAALESVDPRLVEVSRTLGRSPLRAFLEVQLPLAWRGLLAGLVLAFSRALGEFGATILVAGNIPGRTQTLATALFQRVQVGDDAGALRLAGLAAAVAFAALLAVEVLTRRRERRLEG
jgi:molybdate transport system permease protein